MRVIIYAIAFFCFLNLNLSAQKINRKAVVQRHNILVSKFDSLSSLSVGNGNFAFTVDGTGMQSFPDAYAKGVPLGMQSVWGWHSFPNNENLRIEEAQKTYDLEGRKISYTVQVKEPERGKKAVDYFRVNQHRLQLGNIGLEIKKKNGRNAGISDIQNVRQELDLWTGIITSTFEIEGNSVKVTTAAHQQQDIAAFRIESPLLQSQRIAVRLRFPYPNGQWKDVGNDWDDGTKHWSFLLRDEEHGSIRRVIDTTEYIVQLK